MNRILVIGYGNPLRGDDGLGWEVVRRLNRVFQDGEVECLTVHQLMLELAEEISTASMVIFVDASAEEPPAAVSVRPVAPDATLLASFTHDFGPEALLTYSQALYGHAPQASLFTVNGYSFGYAEELSSVVEAQVPGLIERIVKLIEPALSRQNTKGEAVHA